MKRVVLRNSKDRPTEHREDAGVGSEEKLAAMALRGSVVLPRKDRPMNMRPRPVRLKGKPLSEMVIEDRR